MIILTKAQRAALFRVFQRDFPNYITPFKRYGRVYCPHCGQLTPGDSMKLVPSTQYKRFRRLVQPYCDGSGCVMVPWKGMWLGIETDGYTHS